MEKKLFLSILTFVIMMHTEAQDSNEPPKRMAPFMATIQTMGGREIKGWFYKMDSTDVYLLSAQKKILRRWNYKEPDLNGQSFSIKALQINTIALKKKNGGLKGALIGLGAGAAIGAIAGFASGDDPITPYTGYLLEDVFISLGNAFKKTASEKAVSGAVLGGLTGGLAGGLIGALLKKKFIIGGKKETYHDLHDELMKRLIVK